MDAMVITDDAPTREDLLESLRHLNEAAKAISRRGYTGLMSDEYKRRHADIDAKLAELGCCAD